MNAAAPAALAWRPLFYADWKSFLFVHYSVPANELAAATPMELDLWEGKALVSLVCFRLEKMRPAGIFPPAFGRALLRPASDHWFLNVRTYVRGPAGPGIQFLIEWMDNPLSLCLGPLTYGLPYERGHFHGGETRTDGARIRRISDVATGTALEISYRESDHPAAPDAQERFLLEKYTAYTHRREKTRYFHVAHLPWEVARPLEVKISDSLLRGRCPWMARAEYLGAHTSPGVGDVAMGFPHLVRVPKPFPLCPAFN